MQECSRGFESEGLVVFGLHLLKKMEGPFSAVITEMSKNWRVPESHMKERQIISIPFFLQ